LLNGQFWNRIWPISTDPKVHVERAAVWRSSAIAAFAKGRLGLRGGVIAGLDPAIHLFLKMDTRVKPAYDDLCPTPPRT
jgi:hypothetical protein